MKNLRQRLTAPAVLTIALMAVASHASAELVKNGDFSAGNASWTTHNMTVFQNMGFAGSEAMQTACAGHGCVDKAGEGAYFSQILDTLVGATYHLSFLVGETEGPTGEFSLFWDGVQQAEVLNPASSTIDNRQNPGLVQYEFDLVATSTATNLEFHGRQDPGRMAFDNISVTQAASNVPEPAGMALFGLGLAALGWRRRGKA